MNRTLLLAGAAAMALTLAACGKKSEEAAMGAPDANPSATIPTAANEAAAPDFVSKAAISDMYEIESGKLALERATNPEVKAFAQMMVDMHTRTTEDLKTAINASGLILTLPAALPEDKMKSLADLRAAKAEDFDKAYMDAQIDAHQATLDLMTRYAQDGDNATLTAAAAATAPVVQQHLDKADALRKGLS
ncbi:MAG: DUF4142 domain-containing protein [Caulobacter sp.]|nr:DUF4142 domain-containing protein [Caulobacter sp.]